MAKKQEVSKVEKGLPAYLADYQGGTGNEDIDSEDITIPRIKLAQGTSPEVKAGEIPEGAYFLNITGEILAAPGEPLRIIPVVRSKEYILWKDQNFEGGGMFARAQRVTIVMEGENIVRYEWDKKDSTFENKIKGVLPVTWHTKTYVEDNGMQKFGSGDVNDPDSHPAATAHHNFIVSLPDHEMLVAALSLSNTSVKKAKAFNAMLKIIPRGVPMFSRVFSLTAVDETNKANQKYKNYNFKPAGDASQDEFDVSRSLFEAFKNTGYVVDQSADDGDVAEDGKF